MNNPTDLISRASVLEALNGMILPRSGGFTFSLIDQHNQTIRDVIGRLGELPIINNPQPPETSLEKELNELKDNALVLGFNEYFWTAQCDNGKNTDVVSADGETPLEAVLKLKEALNSNR